MSVNIDALFQHLMKDPDIIPPEGEDKEAIAMAMAIQRAKQSNNNTKALSMATANRSVSKLLYFLKAEDDDAESASGAEELKPEINPAEFAKHVANFDKHNERVSDAKKQGKEPEWDTKQQVETAAARREKRPVKKLANGDEISVKGQQDQDDWEAAYDYLGNIEGYKQIDNFDTAIDRALEGEGTGEEQEAEVDPDEEKEEAQAPPETPAGTSSARSGMSEEEVSADMKQKAEERKARQASVAQRLAESEKETPSEPHHSLTSAVDAVSEAAPNVELDHYGNDPDSPFHTSRFGTTEQAAKSFHNIHTAYKREDLAKAYDGLEKVDKQRALNFDGREGGSLVESAIHKMMEEYRKTSPDAYQSPLPKRVGTEEAGIDTAAEEGKEPTPSEQSKIEDTPAYNWFEANVGGLKGADATAWDTYVSDNFDGDLSKVDEHKINDHLHAFLKGRDKKPSTPPKPTPTAEHVKPEVQKDIVIASQDEDNPQEEIEAKLAEHTRSVVDNPALTPHQQKVMIDSANALAEVAAKKASTEDNEIKIELPDDVETSEVILENAADIHIEAEANGESADEKSKAAENLHDAVVSHESAGGDAEPILQARKVSYRKVGGEGKDHANGQFHFMGGGKVWGDLSHRDAIGQPPSSPSSKFPREGDTESTDTPEAQDERQVAFDFDAPAPSPVEQLTEEAASRKQELSAGTQKVQADRDREHKEIVARLRNVNTTDKEAAVKELHDMGERHSPGGGGDAAVQRARADLEGIAPGDPAGAANNPDMHRALGGTPAEAEPEVKVEPEDVDDQSDAEVIAGLKRIRDARRSAPKGQKQQASLDALAQEGHIDTKEADELKTMMEQREETTAEPEAAAEEPPEVKVEPEDTPAKLSDLDALKMAHDELAQQFTQLQADLEEAKKLPNKTKKQKLDKVQKIKGIEREKQAVGKKGKRQQVKIAAHPDTPTETEEVTPTEEASEEVTTTELESEPTKGEAEPEVTVTPPDKPGEVVAEPVGDETPIDEDTRNFIKSNKGITQQIDVRRAHTDTANEIQNKQLDAGFNFDEHGDLLDRQADFSKHTTSMQNGYMELVKHLKDNPEATSVPKDIWDKTFGEEGHLALNKDEDGNLSLGQHSRHADAAAELHKDTDKVIKTGTLKSKKDFLLKNKMTPERLNSLSDENIDKEFNKAHEKISDKAMSDHLAGKLNKEEILKIMAKDHGREGDPAYLDKLREDHQLKTPDELVKEHKAVEKEKAASKFEHQRNDAISSALNMDELSEDSDKLHAMDRARDIAKKMNDSNTAVEKGGKPLLDSNSMSHLKNLLDDAMDKGDLQQDEIDGIADEAVEKGEDYLNDEHKASIDADNERQRAHHEEFLDHAEGMSDEALQRKGHDLDHSKAHEQHEYSITEDGKVGDRMGSSHHYRDEDGSVKHRDASGEGGVPGSEDDAVEGMEAGHPPKLLGLDKNQTLEQQEHFELMKKAADGKLEPGDFDKFKALEANNPDLADPKYKGQVLGAARHQLSAEGGEDKMSAMGVDGEDAQKEAAESSCRPPAGSVHPGADKGWNPDTHRWNDKERLEELKGQAGPGGGTFYPEGSHAGTKDAHLDHDENGVGQPTLVTSTGEHKVTMPQGGSKGMKTADGGAINHADVLGHHLADHPGGKVDAKTMSAMGFDHSDLHTKKGQKRGAWDPKVLTDVKETPGGKFVGKLGQMLQRNKKSEEGQPNASGIARQRARRGKPGSPLTDTLAKIKSYTKEGLKDAAEELPGYLGGGSARDTDRYRDKQTRKAVKKVGKQQSAAQKLTDSINRVAGENG